MADVHSKEVRRFNMSQIRGKNTKPEIVVRKLLHRNGFRFRLHVKDLPGKPDIVLPKYRTVIFVHGCFWHGHDGCKYFSIPGTRTEWWVSKIQRNVTNDEKAEALLLKKNWKIVVIWECELKKDRLADTISRLIKKLKLSNESNEYK